ncbi:MAG: macro domain-containing protein [Deltaproteobacteria bacterium]|nr:macro domain-containing protein [Deltaproteobacteria bacterium]
MRIAVARGSLTEGSETLLVNASNTNVQLGTGVSAAIRSACGAGYQEHIREELGKLHGGPMSPGQVLVTDAGAHPRAKWVAHVAVMDYRDGFTSRSFPTTEVIRAGCRNLLSAIDALPEAVTIAMVALGAGTGQLGVREPTRIACDALRAYRGAKVAGCTFYGYALHEYAAVADVVCAAFPEVTETVPPEVRALFAAKE